MSEGVPLLCLQQVKSTQADPLLLELIGTDGGSGTIEVQLASEPIAPLTVTLEVRAALVMFIICALCFWISSSTASGDC